MAMLNNQMVTISESQVGSRVGVQILQLELSLFL